MIAYLKISYLKKIKKIVAAENQSEDNEDELKKAGLNH